MISPKVRPLALVTGGSSGIGAACVKKLAHSGFNVAIHCNKSVESAEKLASDLPGDLFVIQSDLSSDSGVDHLCELLKTRDPVSVLVNNAGQSIDAPLFSAKIDDFDYLVKTNMKSVWYLTKKISRMMIRNRSGRIIQISSVIGSTGNVGQTTYSMTKAALNAFTKSLALELAQYGILVNSIAPGFIETTMTKDLDQKIKESILNRIPLGRMGRPEEIAEWVSFLASEASYATGSVFHVNGGLYAGG